MEVEGGDSPRFGLYTALFEGRTKSLLDRLQIFYYFGLGQDP